MLLGKTLLNYHLWSCICSWYKMQDWFHMPPRARRAHSWTRFPFVSCTMCAVERETSGKGYRLEWIVTFDFRNAVFLSDILGLFWLFSILINFVIDTVVLALIKYFPVMSCVCQHRWVFCWVVWYEGPPKVSLYCLMELQLLILLQLLVLSFYFTLSPPPPSFFEVGGIVCKGKGSLQ